MSPWEEGPRPAGSAPRPAPLWQAQHPPWRAGTPGANAALHRRPALGPHPCSCPLRPHAQVAAWSGRKPSPPGYRGRGVSAPVQWAPSAASVSWAAQTWALWKDSWLPAVGDSSAGLAAGTATQQSGQGGPSGSIWAAHPSLSPDDLGLPGWVPVPRRGGWGGLPGATGRAENPLGSSEPQQQRKHPNSARERGTPSERSCRGRLSA